MNGRRDERGTSLTVFVATVVAALILVAGLVVDGGAQSTAARRCEQVAAQAARAASDAGAAARAGGRRPDSAQMLAAAREVIAGSGVTGDAAVAGGAIRVRTQARVDTVFLSVIGVSSLGAEGEAEAVLLGPGEGS